MKIEIEMWIDKIKKIYYVIMAIRKFWYDPEVQEAIAVLLIHAKELEDAVDS